MMGRLGPYGCAVVLSAAACVQEHTPSDVLANLRPIYRQEWTTELTDLLHTAIKNEGGLRVAKPAPRRRAGLTGLRAGPEQAAKT